MVAAFWSSRAKIVIVGNSIFELKIIIFVLNYLTLFVYTKTIIHLSVGGKWWIFTSLLRSSVNMTTSHLHFGE